MERAARTTWGEAGARMTGGGVGEDDVGRGGSEDDAGRGGSEDDTLSACVILGLDPRICLPPAPGVVAAAADPRLRGEDDGGEVGEDGGWRGRRGRRVERGGGTAGGEGGARTTWGEAGARMTPSPSSSSGLTRGSASRPLRALSPAPQILASRARMTEERWARMTWERWKRGGRRRGRGADGGWRGRRGGRWRGVGEDDSLSVVILGLDPRICLPPAPGVVAGAADPRLKGEDDGGEVGARMRWARMTGERLGRG